MKEIGKVNQNLEPILTTATHAWLPLSQALFLENCLFSMTMR